MASTMELFHQTQIDVLSAPPMCRVITTASHTFTTGFVSPNQPLPWDSAPFDPYGMWSSGSPTRIKPPVAGYYLATCVIDWADTGAASGSRIINLNKNGGGTGAGNGGVSTFVQNTISPFTDNAFIFTMTMSGIGFFDGVNDYMEVYGWQFSGANTTIDAGRTSLNLVKVHV